MSDGNDDSHLELEATYRKMIEAAIDHAIFSTDADGVIVQWSPGATAIFGWSADEAVGLPFAMTFTEQDRVAGEPDKERIIARTEGVAPDVRWHARKDGSRVFIDGTTRAMYDEAHRVTGYVKVGQDVTYRRLALEELEEGEAGLRTLTQTLEARVAERTAELSESNRALLDEIRDRERAEDERTTLLRTLVTAEEKERGRISRELHDDIGQQMTGLLLGLQVLERSASGQDRVRITELVDVASGLARDLQAAAVALRPASLDNLGLVRALQGHIEDWSTRHGVEASCRAVNVSESRLTDEIETTLYRIVQEGLTNVLKHARARHVRLLIAEDGNEIRAILEDDGVGFDVRQAPAPGRGPRLGLRGMRERLALLRGDLNVESAPGEGTRLIARIPLPPETAPEA
ncbi:MAG TPA: PAS domain S-box protein [Longimicrobiales bacterium]